MIDIQIYQQILPTYSCWQKEEDGHLSSIKFFWWWWLMKKYGRFDDDAWKNVKDLKQCLDSRDTLKI